ncbi:MAG: TonB-dependent receptor [Desulfovibrio sp.]|nr:TonB-dependent receptor [Desulfovibrio sp.]
MVTLICLLALLCPVQSVSASEHEHETVVVTAGRVEEKPRTVTQSVTVISSEEIEKNQYQDMAQLLRNYGIGMGGISEGESINSISIRGMGTGTSGNYGMTSPILVLIDGRRASTANVSMLPMVSIDRVEILRGPAAVQYGSSAIAGVINVITKRGGKEWHGAAEAGYGSWDTTKAMGGLSGSVGPVDIAGGVQWSHQGDDYKTGKWDTLKNSNYHSKLAYVLNAGINFLEEHRLGVTLMSVSNQHMDNHADIFYRPISEENRSYSDRHTHDVDVLYEGGYKKAGLAWQARYFNTGNHWANYSDDGFGSLSEYLDHSRNQGAQAQLSWSGDFLSLTGGFDWLSNKYTQSSTPDKCETDNYAGFLLAKLNLFDEMLILSGGVRYDAYELKAGNKSRDLDNTSFSVGAAFNPWDWLTLRANYGESFRVPTGLETLGYALPEWYMVYHGDIDLKPEKGRGWDAGFEVNFKGLTAGLTYFETRYDNKIIAEPVPNTWDYQYVNKDESQYRGLEGQASFDLGTFFDWPFTLRPYLNFTHILQADDNQGERIPFVRDWELAYGLNFSYPEYGLIADLRFVYMGYMDETYSGETKRTGGKTTADFFIQKTILDFEDKGRLSIKGEIRNIFNTYYETKYGYPQPGRSYYVGLRYDF